VSHGKTTTLIDGVDHDLKTADGVWVLLRAG
jgi:hypothetical protein